MDQTVINYISISHPLARKDGIIFLSFSLWIIVIIFPEHNIKHFVKNYW